MTEFGDWVVPKTLRSGVQVFQNLFWKGEFQWKKPYFLGSQILKHSPWSFLLNMIVSGFTKQEAETEISAKLSVPCLRPS